GDDVRVARQHGGELPVLNLVQAQVALRRRLSAGDGELLAVRAEAQVVDRAEDVGQHLDGFRRGEVPDGDAAVGAGGEQFGVGAEGDGRYRRQRADVHHQLQRHRRTGGEHAGRGHGGRGQGHVELAAARRRGGDGRRRLDVGPRALLRAAVDPVPEDGDVLGRRGADAERHALLPVVGGGELDEGTVLALARQEERLLVLDDGVEIGRA